MGTSTLTIMPIIRTLINGGSIEFDRLVSELVEMYPANFKNDKTVESAINVYAGCLVIEGSLVNFNKEAKSYSQQVTFERGPCRNHPEK